MNNSSHSEGGNDFANGVVVRNIDTSIGKGLFALRDFNVGDVIFEERPLVCCQFLWNSAYGYLACDFCMRPLETAEENVRRLCADSDITLPYPECCQTDKPSVVDCSHCDASYCCEACRQAAWLQYHQVLCRRSFTRNTDHPIDLLQEAWKSMHYPPESACIMLVARILASVIQADDKQGAVNLFMQFCHRTVNEQQEIAHGMLGEKFQSQLDQLLQLMWRALYSEHVQHWLTPDGFRSLMALVATNGQGVGTSPLAVWVRNASNLHLSSQQRSELDTFIDDLYDKLDKEVGTFLNNEGSALYPLQSSCNHSCSPNAMSDFPYSDFRLVMSATRAISAGEQILVSYLDECALQRSRHSRSKVLRENYLFDCRCERCVVELASQPDITSEEELDEDEPVA